MTVRASNAIWSNQYCGIFRVPWSIFKTRYIKLEWDSGITRNMTRRQVKYLLRSVA